MRMCAKCRTENEEVNNYCQRCGNSLIVKEQPVSGVDGSEGKKNVQICPRCRVLHEKGEFCVKCKTKLVPKDPPQQDMSPPVFALTEEKPPSPNEETPSPQTEESAADQKQSPFFSIEREVREVLAEYPLPPLEKQDVEGEASTGPVLPSPSALSQHVMDSPPRNERRRGLLSPLLLGVVGLLILMGFVLYLSSKRSESSASVSGAEAVTAHVVSPSPADPGVPSMAEQETESIKALLENIRQANLRKDIELFMSCYSADFEDTEGKRQSTLESWENFTYLDLSYTLKNHAVSGDKASVKVEWVMKASEANQTQPKENRVVLDASLKKEGGSWRIKETRPGT